MPSIKSTSEIPNMQEVIFEELTFTLDMDMFGIKYRKQGSTVRKLNKFKNSDIKNISQNVQDQHKAYADNIGTKQIHNKITSWVWAKQDIYY